MEDQRVNSVGFCLDNVNRCISLYIGRTPVYFHGSHKAMLKLANEIIEKSNSHHDRANEITFEEVNKVKLEDFKSKEDFITEHTITE